MTPADAGCVLPGRSRDGTAAAARTHELCLAAHTSYAWLHTRACGATLWKAAPCSTMGLPLQSQGGEDQFGRDTDGTPQVRHPTHTYDRRFLLLKRSHVSAKRQAGRPSTLHSTMRGHATGLHREEGQGSRNLNRAGRESNSRDVPGDSPQKGCRRGQDAMPS